MRDRRHLVERDEGHLVVQVVVHAVDDDVLDQPRGAHDRGGGGPPAEGKVVVVLGWGGWGVGGVGWVGWWWAHVLMSVAPSK